MKKLLILALCSATLITSCKKGDTGPAGPAGTNGNANVTSGTITIPPSAWAWDATNSMNYVNMNGTSITSDIVSKGAVMVYISTDNATWSALPCTIWGNPSVSLTFSYSLNKVQIQASNTNSTINTFNTLYAKIVVIAASQKAAHPNTDWKDYNQVMAVLAADQL